MKFFAATAVALAALTVAAPSRSSRHRDHRIDDSFNNDNNVAQNAENNGNNDDNRNADAINNGNINLGSSSKGHKQSDSSHRVDDSFNNDDNVAQNAQNNGNNDDNRGAGFVNNGNINGKRSFHRKNRHGDDKHRNGDDNRDDNRNNDNNDNNVAQNAEGNGNNDDNRGAGFVNNGNINNSTIIVVNFNGDDGESSQGSYDEGKEYQDGSFKGHKYNHVHVGTEGYKCDFYHDGGKYTYGYGDHYFSSTYFSKVKCYSS